MQIRRWILALGGIALAGLALGAGEAMAAWDVNLPRGVTPISNEIYDLHMLIIWIIVAIAIVVYGAMLISIYLHRKSRGVEPAKFHHSTTMEIIWTAIPCLILVGMAWPATKTLIAMEDTSAADMTVKVTGYQWKWRYDYIEDGVTMYSNLAATSRAAIYGDPTEVENYLLEVDKEVVLPTNKKIRLLLTADDVIHAWWVPAFGMKKDAIPGFINEIWVRIEEEGTYRGQCAELCGKDHGFMPIVVVAKNEEDYREWVAANREPVQQVAARMEAAPAAGAAAATTTAAEADREWTKDELMARGAEVYLTNCVACHQPNGQGMPGTFPAITGSPIATGPVDAHLDRVLNGKPGTAMLAFAPQLNDVDIAAVMTYQRNALGNSVGDVVEPAAVKAARK